MPGLGDLQDGALRHNNPVNIALWESSRIWPIDTPRDVVLSLGTGTTPTAATPQTTPARHTFNDKFIPRLCRSFLTSIDGELTWRDLLNHLESDDGHKYFRLNLQFIHDEPRLDDVTAMDRLSRDVNACKDDEKMANIKFALLASCFFFELKRAPKFDASGFYTCQGEIRVRSDYSKILMALRQINAAPIEFFKDHVSLGRIDQATDLCSGCCKFRKKVCFFVRHPTETVSISINMDDFRGPVSGFPQTMARITEQQHLTCPFYSEETLMLPKTACTCLELQQARCSRPVKRRLSSTYVFRSRRKRTKRL
ncbi:hypothetical protein LTR85_012267 [Meristemomyces frigidus]|nr:hypothetical protein LTR85_012267 [Meristemomyces frigidus]